MKLAVIMPPHEWQKIRLSVEWAQDAREKEEQKKRIEARRITHKEVNR